MLGVAGGFGHDAAACLVADGELVAMVEEERLCRAKRALGRVPSLAMQWCLDSIGLSSRDVDTVALSWDPGLSPDHGVLSDTRRRVIQDPVWEGRAPILATYSHHLAHAASAHRCAARDRTITLVVDGNGEDAATSVWEGRGDDLVQHASWPLTQSLGHFYNAVTAHVGLGSSESAGKLMGLAPYGDAAVLGPPPLADCTDGYWLSIDPQIEDVPVPERFRVVRRFWSDVLTQLAGPPAQRDEWAAAARTGDVPERLAHLAAWAQAVVESCIIRTFATWTARLGCRDAALAGGVALNCTTNGRLLQDNIVDSLFVQPAAHDAGGALGSALLASNAWVRPPFDVAVGPLPDSAAAAAEAARLGLRTARLTDVAGETAEMLADGRVIGWAQGRSEVGPRALGHRSILASPARVATRDRVNAIKGREWWRPLSPIVTGSERQRFPTDSPYMLLALQAPQDWSTTAPAVVHVDGSCRPQTVDSTQPVGQVAKQFAARTGLEVLLNTSLNLAGEPMAATGVDAVSTFARSSLDALVVEDVLIER